MQLHPIDIAIMAGYIVLILAAGWLLSKRASTDLNAYFLAGKSLPWYIIGTSHGASGFDITGTMWFVAMLYTYGLKAAWIPWIWPVFDRVLRQVYLGAWIRRSNVLTGAEWMRTRFGHGRGGDLSHISVVVYAVVLTVGFLSYAFQGIGKFAVVFFPWNLAWGPFSNSDMYAVAILAITTGYLLLGGWYSVVVTDILQFALMAVASVLLAGVAMARVSPDMLRAAVPEGWTRLAFGWRLDLDWSGLIDGLNAKIVADGYSLFGAVIMMMLLKGLLVSMAGPTPGYAIQHVLSTRNPREAALENWWMSIVQLIPRFLMIAGIAVLGVAFFSPQVRELAAGGAGFDFEKVLPYVVRDFVPVGLVGVVMAGLLAAFMSTFDSTVNAGAAYIVNDIYKCYLRPEAPARHYVRCGYLCSVLLVLVAIVVGLRVPSIHAITTWITFALYGGYLAPNILKWHWWRFNGYGYFAGMVAGVFGSIAPLLVRPGMNKMLILPISLALSLVASIWVSLRTPPEADAVLDGFYRTVRPWGAWGPVRRRLQQQYPGLRGNGEFRWDAFNVANGIVWQMALIVLPIALVIRQWRTFCLAVLVLAVTSVVMKRAWYDRLGRDDPTLQDGAKAAVRH